MTGSASAHSAFPTPGPAFSGATLHSRFVQRLHRRYAELLPLLPAGAPTRETLTEALQALQARGHALGDALRILRQLTLERLARLDCEAQAGLDVITRGVTWLAEVTLDAAWEQVMRDLDELHGAPQTAEG